MKTDVMVKKRILKAFKAISITLVVLLIMFKAGPVLAGQARLGDSPVAFAIASQTLADALADFQNDSGVNIIYKDRFVQGKTTSGLSGKHSPAAGLEKLLAGTGLTYQVTAENTVVLKENKMVVAQREVEKREEVKKKEGAKRPVAMEQMTVTATKSEMNVREIPASVNVVTPEDIEMIPNALSFGDALEFVPGVFVNKGPGLSYMMLRGQFAAVMINGRESSRFHHNGSFPTELLDMGAIERIEVVKGPQSAVQGTKAMSGVINVVTKKGDKDNPYAELNALYGTGGEIRGGAALGGGIGDFNYFLAGSAKTQQEYETPEGTNPYSTQDLSNFYANLGYDINDRHSISLELRHDDIYDINYRFPSYPGYSSTWTDLTQEEFEYSGIFLQYNGEIFENFSIFADLGYATFDSKDYNAYPIDSWLAGNPHKKAKMDEKHTFAELRANYEVMPDQLKLIAGVQYKKSDMEWWKSEPSWSDPDVMDEMTIDKEQSYIAPFAQVEYRPIDYFLVQGGIRHDSYSYSDDTPDKSKTTKKLGVSIFPFVDTYHDWTTLFTVYNEGFRAPLGNELFYPVVGNPDLEPEEAEGWEVGLKQRLSTWANIQLSYFSTDYTDQIKVVYPSTPGPPKFQNIADNTIKGWEAGVQAYPLGYLRLFVSYTDMEQDEVGYSYYSTPNEILSYGVSIEDFHNIYASVYAITYDDWQFDETTSHENEGKTYIDVKVAYHWELKHGVLFKPYVSVENLTDEKYYVTQLDEGIAWHVGASLRVNF